MSQTAELTKATEPGLSEAFRDQYLKALNYLVGYLCMDTYKFLKLTDFEKKFDLPKGFAQTLIQCGALEISNKKPSLDTQGFIKMTGKLYKITPEEVLTLMNQPPIEGKRVTEGNCVLKNNSPKTTPPNAGKVAVKSESSGFVGVADKAKQSHGVVTGRITGFPTDTEFDLTTGDVKSVKNEPQSLADEVVVKSQEYRRRKVLDAIIDLKKLELTGQIINIDPKDFYKSRNLKLGFLSEMCLHGLMIGNSYPNKQFEFTLTDLLFKPIAESTLECLDNQVIDPNENSKSILDEYDPFATLPGYIGPSGRPSKLSSPPAEIPLLTPPIPIKVPYTISIHSSDLTVTMNVKTAGDAEVVEVILNNLTY